MSAASDLKVDWANVQTRTITADGVDFAYRELGEKNPGVPVVFLIHWPRSWTTGTRELSMGSLRSAA